MLNQEVDQSMFSPLLSRQGEYSDAFEDGQGLCCFDGIQTNPKLRDNVLFLHMGVKYYQSIVSQAHH